MTTQSVARSHRLVVGATPIAHIVYDGPFRGCACWADTTRVGLCGRRIKLHEDSYVDDDETVTICARCVGFIARETGWAEGAVERARADLAAAEAELAMWRELERRAADAA